MIMDLMFVANNVTVGYRNVSFQKSWKMDCVRIAEGKRWNEYKTKPSKEVRMLSPTQMKVLKKFREEFLKFLQGPYRNIYVTSGRSISVYTRKGVHRISGETRKTLDIANITVARPGKGLGMATIALMHKINPFEVTYIESILNEGFAKRLLRDGWLPVPEANPISVYREKK